MERFQLQSEIRDGAGKGVARKLRMKGRLPAILYGRHETPVGLSVSETDVRNILREHPDSAIVDLNITEGEGDTVNAIIRDVQRHPGTGKLLHVDLQRIRLDEKVRVAVHVHVHGVPVGVKDQMGILEHGTRTVDVMCLPSDIPESIVVDVAALRIHDSMKLKDVSANYPKLEFLDDPDTHLATVIPPVVEAVVAPVEAEPAEPELIRKPAEEGEAAEEPQEGKEKEKPKAKGKGKEES